MEEDLTLNHYSFIDLKNEYNTKEVMHTFDRFFFAFGRFPVINDLAIILTGEVPSFVKSNDVISPSELYKKFSSESTRGLVCVQYLAALNIHLGGDKTIPKDAMSEVFHNLSMQAMSKSDNSILLKLDATNRLNKSINSLLVNKTLTYENAEIKKLQNFFDSPTVVSNELTINNKTESTIVKEILKAIFLLQKQLRKLNKKTLSKIVFF